MARSSILPFIALCAVLLFSGCVKSALPKVSRDGAIGAWIKTSVRYSPSIDYDGDGDRETEVLPYFYTCNADDVLFINNDGTGYLSEGNSKCRPVDPAIVYDFFWDYSVDNYWLVNVEGDESEYKVLQADGITFKISYEREEYDGRVYTITETYQAR